MDDKNKNTNQPSGPTVTHGAMGPVHHGNRRVMINGLVILLVILACIGGYLYYQNHHKKPASNAKPAGTYSQVLQPSSLKTQSTSGSTGGQGISLYIPDYFLKGTGGTGYQFYDDNYVNPTTKQVEGVVGNIYVFSTPYSSTNPQIDAATYVKNMSDASSASYKTQSDAALAFVTKYQPTRTVTLTSTSQLSTKQGYIFNFNAPSSISSSSYVPKDYTIAPGAKQPADGSSGTAVPTTTTPTRKGELIHIVGKNASYDVLISAVDYNYDQNSSVWQKVLDSIKVDQ